MTDHSDDFDWPPADMDQDPQNEVLPIFPSEVAPSEVAPVVPAAVRIKAVEVAHVVTPETVPDAVPHAVTDVAIDDLPIAMVPTYIPDAPSDRFDASVAPAISPVPPRTPTWPVMAALLVGLVFGFGGGYLAAGRLHPLDLAWLGWAAPTSGSPPGSQTTGASASAAAAREYTESVMTDAPGAAGHDVARGPVRDAGRDSGRVARDRVTPQTEHRTEPRIEPQTETQAEPVPATGRVLVRSTPADAQVFVDGRERGRTPTTIHDLSIGVHRVRIVRDGYVIDERRVAVTAAQPSQSVLVTLEPTHSSTASAAGGAVPESSPVDGPSVGALEVESRPAGAQLFVDGVLAGTTPFAADRIGSGKHTIRIEYNGYQRWVSSVMIVRGERNRITASLER